MTKISAFLFITLTSCLLCMHSVLGAPQPTSRIRGIVAELNGQELLVNTREGKSLKISLAEDTKINVLSPLSLDHVKQGSFVGVTAIQNGPGTPFQAKEVHIFPESMRGTGEGHYDWDLEPGSSMTNANVDAIVSTNTGKELTLSYKGGSQKIVVPLSVPIITFTPADKSMLLKGAHVFVVAQQAAAGNLTALRILVGKDGINPPM